MMNCAGAWKPRQITRIEKKESVGLVRIPGYEEVIAMVEQLLVGVLVGLIVLAVEIWVNR